MGWAALVWVQVLSAERRELSEVFTGLRPGRLIQAVKYCGGQALDPSRPGRPWALSLEDRVLLVAVHYRTNLTMRQLGPLFGVSPAAAHRIIDRRSVPFLAVAHHVPGAVEHLAKPRRRRGAFVRSRRYFVDHGREVTGAWPHPSDRGC